MQMRAGMKRRPASVQALYYLAGGAWPVLWYRSFEWVTGRKREPWLVKSMGLTLLVIGVALQADPEGRSAVTRRLGVGSALVIGAVDVWYAAIRRRIRVTYLLDAVVEGLFLVAWRRHWRAAAQART